MAENAYALSIATLQRRIASLSNAHKALGEENPVRSALVGLTMKGIKRRLGRPQTEAKPLLKEDLVAVLGGMGNCLIDIRDRAILLIGFAGALRRSELVALDFENVEHVREGIIVHIVRSKTDQFGRGRKIGIPLGRSLWCPVRRLKDWSDAAGFETGPIFRAVNRHSHVGSDRLSAEAVSIVVKRRLLAAGYDPHGYSGHSLRAGLVTSAAKAGVSSWKIRAQTGHASDAMVSRYVRMGDLFNQNASGSVL